MGHKTRDKKLDFVDRLLKHQLEFYEEFRRQQRNYREEQLRASRRQRQECKLDSYLALPNLPSIIELPAFEEQEEQLSRLLFEQMEVSASHTSRDNTNNSEHQRPDLNLTTYHQWTSYRTCREQQRQRQQPTTFYFAKDQFCNEFGDDDYSNEDENECDEKVEDNDEEAVRRWFANFSANHQTAYMPLSVCPNV